MKKILFIGFVILNLIIGGCDNEKPIEKPFIIIYKYPNSGMCSDDYCHYQYIDQNGNKSYFCETENKYNIGDTIK
jgi:hypothetical protein